MILTRFVLFVVYEGSRRYVANNPLQRGNDHTEWLSDQDLAQRFQKKDLQRAIRVVKSRIGDLSKEIQIEEISIPISCSVARIDPKFLSKEERLAGKSICDGPMFEAIGYSTDGSSLYRCKKHAEFFMRVNPAGPIFQPMKGEKGQ